MITKCVRLFLIVSIIFSIISFGEVFAFETPSSNDIPEKNMTRAMFVTALGSFANAEVYKDAKTVFTDLEEGSWYVPYIEWASRNGIIKGVTESKFMPDAAITREQAAVIISRYLINEGYALVADEAIDFVDAGSISEYAEKDVSRCCNAGIFNGNPDNTFLPLANITSAETATVFTNIANYVRLNSKTTVFNNADEG